MVGVTEKDYNETFFLRMQWQEEEVRPRKQAAYLCVRLGLRRLLESYRAATRDANSKIQKDPGFGHGRWRDGGRGCALGYSTPRRTLLASSDPPHGGQLRPACPCKAFAPATGSSSSASALTRTGFGD